MPTEQYIYTLKLIPRLLDERNWTEKENEIVQAHFNQLKRLMEEDKVVLAGRTLNDDESTFGIVILQTNSEAEAREIMEYDPAVKKGIMNAELYPYRVALFNKRFNV
ncbi:YciI family protein [Fredinandcohnia sp. 179-A 10B2 NHS]|uniref:YciI family protein n=1 Tax=Fredinandcohnia sp. 179-A 10B2 NHS TaxID=3235176 RepID=UPI0039A1FAC6